MAAITTSGSNFDVQGLVSQLMSLEQAPLTASKRREANYNDQVSSLGKLKSTLSDFQTAMRGFFSGTALNVNKAESSDDKILKGAASSTAAAGTYNINVTVLAAAQTLALSTYSGGSGAIASASTGLGNTAGNLSITIGSGSAVNIAIGANASLQNISDAINAAGIDVSASVVNSGAEGYKLALTSKKSGSDGAFSISGGAALGIGFVDYDKNDNSAANLAKRTAAPTDAQLTINGVAITSSSNKLTEAMTGLEVSLYKTGSATLTVGRDNEAVIKNVQAFVDGYNKVKAQVDSMYKQASTGGAVTDASGKVLGTATRLDGSVRMMMQSLANELGVGISGVDMSTGNAFLSQIGISMQKDGSLKLDNDTFKKALDKDITAVSKLFSNSASDGFADRLNVRINDMLAPTGMMQIRTDSLNGQIRSEKQKQDQVQARLDLMQKRLIGQFSRLDSSLAAMKNQSNYLASMLR